MFVSTKSVLSLSTIEVSLSGITSTLPPSQIEVSFSFVDPSLENVDPDAFEYVDMVPKSTKSLVFNRESSVPPSTKDPSSSRDPFANKDERFEARSVKTESEPILKTKF